MKRIAGVGADLDERVQKTHLINARQQIIFIDGGLVESVGLHRILMVSPDNEPLGKTWEDMLTDEVKAKLLD